ncbi:MAG: cyclophilin family peptidyl-prolyl cis-trans isomerase [Saprospiraceae bacterium]|jgi:cyclophilin family peptidyl-prolyl cis-trans isomerase
MFNSKAYFILCGILIMILVSCSDSTSYGIIETDFGEMKVELYNSTPSHRDNFVKLAKEGFYDDLLFHRVMKGFMIQGGDPDSKGAPAGSPLGMGGPGYTIDQEIGAPHFKGCLAAARTPDSGNPEKKSSGSQFYIVQGQQQSREDLQARSAQKGIEYNEDQIAKYENIGGRPDLDMEYTVFGEIVSGMEVIDKIAAIQTDSRNRPRQDLKMKIRITSN